VFYEPSESFFQVELPQLINLNQQSVNVVSSNPKVAIELVKEPSGNYLQAKGTTGEAMTIERTHIYVFSDKMRSHLMVNIEIVVHSVSTIFTKAVLGQSAYHSLPMSVDRARTVKVFSSNPSVVSQPRSDRGKELRLIPG
jgi:hypothetical protein